MAVSGFSSVFFQWPCFGRNGRPMGSRLPLPPPCQASFYTVSADGEAPKELTRGERDELFPNWSPDGTSLIFGNSRFDLPGSDTNMTYRLDLKTNQLTTVKDSSGTW